MSHGGQLPSDTATFCEHVNSSNSNGKPPKQELADCCCYLSQKNSQLTDLCFQQRSVDFVVVVVANRKK